MRALMRGLPLVACTISFVAAQGVPDVSDVLSPATPDELSKMTATIIELRKTDTVEGYQHLLEFLRAGTARERVMARMVLPEVISSLRAKGSEILAAPRVATDLVGCLCDRTQGVNDEAARLWVTLAREGSLQLTIAGSRNDDTREDRLQNAWRELVELILRRAFLAEGKSILSALASDPDPCVRMLVVWTIAYLAIQATSGDDLVVGWRGATIDCDWALDIVIKAIVDTSMGVRRSAISALSLINGASAGRILAISLRSRDQSIRDAVMGALWARWIRGEQGGVSAEMWVDLGACVERDQPRRLRMTVLVAIGELARQWSGEAEQILRKALRIGDLDDIRAAIWSIAKLPGLSEDLIGQLRDLLRDDDDRVVLLAASALASHHEKSVEPVLLRLCATDDPEARAFAAGSLTKLGDEISDETWQLFVEMAGKGETPDIGWEGLLRCSSIDRLARIDKDVESGLAKAVTEDCTLLLPALLLARIRKTHGEKVDDELGSAIALQAIGEGREWLLEGALRFILQELKEGPGKDYADAIEWAALSVLDRDDPVDWSISQLALQCLAAARSNE